MCTVHNLGEKSEERAAGGKDNLSDTVDTTFLTVRDRKTHK